MVIRADDPFQQVSNLDGVRLPDGTTRTCGARRSSPR